MRLFKKIKYLGEKSLIFEKFSLHLNEFRKNLAANLDRSPCLPYFPGTSFPSCNMRASAISLPAVSSGKTGSSRRNIHLLVRRRVFPDNG